MEKKQTAVEWLESQLKERYSLLNSEPLFEQAKEMENSQKKEMYVKGLKNYDPTYLNEIYEGNNSEVTISNNKHECCTPKGQVPRYVDCVGCDKKPIEGATLSYAQAQKDSFSIMEKKQSSVELFAIALYEKGFLKGNGDEINDLLEEHKAMHKEEIEDAWLNGMKGEMIAPLSINNYKPDAEEYYSETFGGEK